MSPPHGFATACCSADRRGRSSTWMFERIRVARARRARARPLRAGDSRARPRRRRSDREAAVGAGTEWTQAQDAVSEPRRFPSPFEVEAPEARRTGSVSTRTTRCSARSDADFEEGKFWFWDSMHNPEPIYPFDTIMTESWWVALNQYTTRVWVIPPALGIDQRIVNGYLYVSPNSITDPKVIEERVAFFTKRAGHYYENWDRALRPLDRESRGLHRATRGDRDQAISPRSRTSGS